MFARTKNLVISAVAAFFLISATGCTTDTDIAEPPGSQTAVSPTSTSPSPSPTPTAKPTPTPTPIPASSNGPAKNWPVPKMPAVAKEKSEEGIAAFALYYFELAEYTIQTNDSALIRKVTLKSCITCGESFIDTADNNKEAGAWLAAAPFNAEVTKTILQPQNGIALLITQQGEMTAYMSDGTIQGVFPASKKPDPATMLLKWDNGWHVETLEYLDEK